jgi:hypothetical protein
VATVETLRKILTLLVLTQLRQAGLVTAAEAAAEVLFN